MSFKTEFEVENCRGKRMNLRMQERFCQEHKARKAQSTWQDRSYPEVDWFSLDDKLKRHHAHIQAVIDGKVKSCYREDLEKRVRDGSTRTAMQSIKAGTNSAANVGYYGTRGQKVM